MSKIWTPEEDMILADTSVSYDTICKNLPHRTKRSIWGRAHRLGYNRDQNVIQEVNSENQRNETWTELLNDKEFCEIVDGEILGDGCIFRKKVKNRQCYEYSFIAGSIQRDYAEYVHGILSKKLKSKAKIDVKKPNIHKKNGFASSRDFYSYRFSNVVFRNFYDRWYPSGSIKTTIPDDLVLTKTIVLHWYLGDGSLDSRKHAHMFDLRFHTENFYFQTVEKLSVMLNNTFNIISKIDKTKKKYFRIRVHGDHARNLLKQIGKSPVRSLDYKWRDWKEE